MYKKWLCFNVILASIFLCSSCEIDSFDVYNAGPDVDVKPKEIVLGEKLPNPYSLTVMKKAVNAIELESDVKLKSLKDIDATHLYLRFKPQDSLDVMKLESDTSIFFYTYPLDYVIEEEGDYYHDPSLPEDTPTYMYCVVKVNQDVPDVKYDVIEDLYILEEVNVIDDFQDENDISLKTLNESSAYWERLQNKAWEIVGCQQCTNKSKWSPCGYLYYEDTSKNKIVPLEGVPVKCRVNIFVTHQCCTNANGYFSVSKVHGDVNYSIDWRRDHFKIRPTTGLSVAETVLKKNTKNSVTKTFLSSEEAWKYASIFRGAHFYYYHAKDYGMSSPTKNSLTIRASNKSTGDVLGCYNNKVFGADVHIYSLNRKSSEIFCTTTHEIAHSVHHFWNNTKYYDYDSIVKESWARGASWMLTSQIYSEKEFSLTYDHVKHTGIIKDLIDSDISPRDNVSGVTMSQIESAIKNSSDWNGFKNNIISYYPNKKADVENLFNYWCGK